MKTIRLFCALLTSLLALSRLAASEAPSVLIPRYEKISAALVVDDLGGATAAARQLAQAAGQDQAPALAAAARTVAQANDLTAAREAFKGLSREVIALARHEKGYFIVNCPMANADWLQSTRKIANPYFGKAMSACGSVTAETKG
jgi:DNA-binding FadR family transcriptional regulator